MLTDVSRVCVSLIQKLLDDVWGNVRGREWCVGWGKSWNGGGVGLGGGGGFSLSIRHFVLADIFADIFGCLSVVKSLHPDVMLCDIRQLTIYLPVGIEPMKSGFKTRD